MTSSKAAQFAWRVFYLLCIVRVVRVLSADGRVPSRACDNGSDVYSFASNICTSEKCKVLLTSARLRDDQKALTR